MAATATPAAAHVGHPRVEIGGGGWGHRRGMGQYGALGYARDHGWTSRQILDHFYGGTTQGPAPTIDNLDPDRLRVQLAGMNNRNTAVTLAKGRMVVVDPSGNRRRTVSEPAMRLVPTSSGFEIQTAGSCSGPWTAFATVDNVSAVGIRVELDPDDPSDDDEVIGRDSLTLLGVCGPSGRTWYDGEIWSHRTNYGQRTVNVVTIEQYLRGVVPNEMPASWPAAALEAQAVAARSYALAGDGRWGSHADTCDNTYCQVYDGRVTTRGGTRVATHSRTDAAIATTAGQVRLTSSGRIARTEFSSSTGGHTTGPSFTPVEDLGDATSANPNASWSVTVGLSRLASRYGLGPVQSIEVTERDGNGRFGGGATKVTIVFRDGTRTMTGNAVRIYFGLKSDLFDFGDIEFEPTNEPPAEDTSPTASDFEPIVEAMYRRLAGRAPTGAELDRWSAKMVDGETSGRRALATALVRSEHFSGKLVDDLYRTTFGRRPDERGRQHWIGRLTTDGTRQVTYQEIGAWFFGSTEYFRRAGNTDDAFIDRLYTDLLGRRADAGGRSYWLGVLDRGSAADVVTWFYHSAESRRSRAANLHRMVYGTNPTATQLSAAAKLLATDDDLDVAAKLGAAINP
ncbi:MAG: SpoIID/LytB domain-containing protein [Acidimicrobiia bacterium]|nr:SpoIID/LytB domain-containing protein [Acidimicrobiia bacterium]